MPDRAGAAEAAELRFVIHNELDIIMADDDDVCGGQNQSAKCLRHYIEDVYNRTRRISTSLLWTQFFSNSIREKEKKRKKGPLEPLAGPGRRFSKEKNHRTDSIRTSVTTTVSLSLSFDRTSPPHSPLRRTDQHQTVSFLTPSRQGFSRAQRAAPAGRFTRIDPPVITADPADLVPCSDASLSGTHTES